MKKENMIFKNIKFFIPLLFKISPFTVIITIVRALLTSINRTMYVVFPALILKELANEIDVTKIIIIVLVFVCSTNLIGIILTFLGSLQEYNARKADFFIDEMLNEKIIHADYFKVEDPKFLDFVDRAQKGMKQYTNGIYVSIFTIEQIIASMIQLISCFGIIIFSGHIIIVIPAVIGIFLTIIIFNKIQNYEQFYRQKLNKVYRLIYYFSRGISSFRNHKELRMYDGKNLIEYKFDEYKKVYEKEHGTYTKKNILLNAFDVLNMYIIIRFLTIVILIYSIFKSYDLALVATFSLLYNSVTNLDISSSNLSYSLQQYFKSCVYQNDFIDLMKMESVFSGNLKISKINSIEFRNVTFKYPNTENYILEDVSFKLSDKKKISLVGLNGAGKTTIIKLLCRFFEVEKGEILVNDININQYEIQSYLDLISVVFQDFKIISFSIKNNIENIKDDQKKLYNCLERSQVLDKVLSLPNKENTYINKWFDKTGVEFSGGEMQKFAMARALYKDSEFVVLDEPTSALDPMAEAKMYYQFNEIVGQKLTLFISHRLSSCIFSDNILVLDGSRIVESGKHNELMKNENSLYKKMFDAQSEYYK